MLFLIASGKNNHLANALIIVINPISRNNLSILLFIPLKNTSVKDANSKTIPILIKFIVTKIVAKSLLGDFNNLWINSFVLSNSFLSDSKDEGFNENKATSAPESIAEKKSKTKVMVILTNTTGDSSINIKENDKLKRSSPNLNYLN